MILFLMEKYFKASGLVINLFPGCESIARLYWRTGKQIEISRSFIKAQRQAKEIFQAFDEAFNEMEKKKHEST